MAIQHPDLVAKEVALGLIREWEPRNGFLHPTITPWKDVQSDDVIFRYIAPEVTTLTPARAEDAESEMLQHDDLVGLGRASIIDWAQKHHYVASDVSRWREYANAASMLGTDNFRLTVGAMTEDYQSMLARDARRRRENLDNRLEWLAINGLWNGAINYNDGKITFDVNYNRPAAQQNQPPPNGTWDLLTSDPIADIEAMNDTMEATHGFRLTRAYMSDLALRNLHRSEKFLARLGFAVAAGTNTTALNYVEASFNRDVARSVIEAATGVQITPYNGYYRSRPLGSQNHVVNYFADRRDVVFLPPEDQIADVTDLGMGFAAMLTSPHPEGNWSTGFYAWERDTVDPWGRDLGSGVKAFPLFPNLQYTYTMRVLP